MNDRPERPYTPTKPERPSLIIQSLGPGFVMSSPMLGTLERCACTKCAQKRGIS